MSNRVDKVGATTGAEYNKYVNAEIEAYNKLERRGFYCGLWNPETKKITVSKIINKNRNNEFREIYEFDDWQDAVEKLINNGEGLV